MGSEWINCALEDLVTLQRGHDLPEHQRKPGRVPVMGSFGLTGYHNIPKAKGPGVTVGRSGGSIGVVCYCVEDYWPLNTTLYVTDFHSNDARFAYYFLKSIDFSAYNSGSAQPSLNRNYIHPIPIRIPPLPEQKAIAHILGTLDDKIEINKKMNKTLETIARVIFKSWFVDFDPVWAKAEGRQPEGMDAETAALFPDSFEDSELGMIPKGWRVTTLGESVARITKGTTPRKKDIMAASDPFSINFLKVKDISNHGEIDIDNLEKIPESIHLGVLKRSILKTGDVLFSIAGTIGRVSVVTPHLDNSNTNQAIALIRPNKNGLPFNYIQQLMKTDIVQTNIKAKIVQAVQANVSLTVLSEVQFVLPLSALIKRWIRITSNVYRKKYTLCEENRTLINLRETLLPKLLSGEIRVKVAEKFFGGMKCVLSSQSL